MYLVCMDLGLVFCVICWMFELCYGFVASVGVVFYICPMVVCGGS